MRSIPALLAVAATILALIATPAAAASGNVYVRDLYGPTPGNVRTFANPNPYECHDLGVNVYDVLNSTEGTIGYFDVPGCRGFMQFLPPGVRVTTGFASFWALS
ncbi:hypothetical protein ABZ897_45380 [Nonomuraea sp. NPDC046802]|uniref:hypothetical protein n=1 Tax=Nonomuraea sp. NPDC046802 TaxID=3154919 RepID=UPI00340E027A